MILGGLADCLKTLFMIAASARTFVVFIMVDAIPMQVLWQT